MNRKVKLAILGFISLCCYASLASGYTVTFENNTGLDPDSYMICMQGTASEGSGVPNLMLQQDSGNNYSFQTFTPETNNTGAVKLFPAPALMVTPGSSGTTITVDPGDRTVNSGRLYYYVAPKADSCDAFLGYNVEANSANFAGFVNNFEAGGAYVLSEITSLAANNNIFDLSCVDSFALPAQAYTTGNSAQYDTLGQSLVSLTSAQNLQAIRADFISAMTALGSAGEHYKRLATEPFSGEGKNYSYPSGTGPVLNPHSFLVKKIAPPPASGIVYPGANSALNSIFDGALNALFGGTIYVNKTGNPGDTYMGVPVSSGLPYPSGAAAPNTHLPATLPGMIFCDEANSGNCTTGTASFTAYNPAGMTIYNQGDTGGYDYITGTLAANSRTITLDDPLNAGALVDTTLFPEGIRGWYVTGSDNPIASTEYYVESCSPGCTSSAVTSITLDSSLNTASIPNPVSGQLILQAWNLAANALAPSSGDSVFGNFGVLGGISWATNNPDIINVLVSALNRGVSGLRNSQHDFTDITHTDSYVWSEETNWYPASATKNEYANYLHTRELGGKPLFAWPHLPSKSAQNMTMGMAYGFGYDENPLNGVQGPQVPSEWNGTVNDDAHIVVTLGPWLLQSPTQQYLLTVSKTGTGAADGVVKSTTVTPPGGAIDCGTNCSETYASGTSVTLKASGSSLFTGWSGACSGTTLICEVTMSQARNAIAGFSTPTPGAVPLHVQVNGPGTVTGGGINCGSTCSAEETANSQVTLTATPQGGASFVGWGGACSGSGLTCNVTMSQAEEVTATFASDTQYSLTVTNGGGGKVTSTPAGIDCESACIASFNAGTEVEAIARPDAGYVFSGWGGACTGTQTCDLVMNANKSLTATFSAVSPGQVSLTVHDYGSGQVTSSPAGISCGSTCGHAYDVGTQVTLTATPDNGWTFAGWSGGVCSGTDSCAITLNQSEFVNAVFEQNTPPIPTLGEWGMIIFMLMMIGAAGWHLWRRKKIKGS